MRRPPVGTSAACWCERRFRHVPFQGRSRIDYIICCRVRKENRPRALSRTVSEGRLRRLPVPACQDLVSVAVHVRFTPQSGHRSARRECPLSAKSALTRCSKKDRYSIPSSARVSSVGGTSRGIRGTGGYGISGGPCGRHAGLRPANFHSLVHFATSSGKEFAELDG